jgi:putative ABC transport system permease protein
MLKNYFKIAWKVLLRRKFFTFVSLFGISFTLMILLVVSAFVDQMFRPAKPGSRFDRCLFLNRILLESESTGVESILSYHYINQYVRPMKTPEAIAIVSTGSETFSYVGNRKLSFERKYSDATFWDIIEFRFIEGRPYDSGMVKNADRVAVIDDRTRREIFGSGRAVGEYIETSEGTYRVIGVIPREEIRNSVTDANIFVPITTSESAMTRTSLFANCYALILAADESDFDAIRLEYSKRLEQARLDYAGEWDRIECPLRTQAVLIWGETSATEEEDDPIYMLLGIIGTMILFMLFPAINLVNINVSRIIERSSEIGVRKAFGASSAALVFQFIVENVFLTLLGGIIALAMAAVALDIITDSGLLPYGTLELNLPVFSYGLILCLFFGVFSGVLPAYKMSRLHPVEALKGAEA